MMVRTRRAFVWGCTIGAVTACGARTELGLPALLDAATADDARADDARADDARADDARSDVAVAIDASRAHARSCDPGGPGLTDCQVGDAGLESCCTALAVTGGTYFRQYYIDAGAPIYEDYPATISSFRLDRYEVTVGRYRQFANAWPGYKPANGDGKHAHFNGGDGLEATGGGYEGGWSAGDDRFVTPTTAWLGACAPFATWTDAPAQHERLPMNCVNWWEAYAFCIWDGGFLASQAEWEYAAAGGAEQRAYPWGATEPGTKNDHAIYGDNGKCYYPSGTLTGCGGVDNLARVGTPALGLGKWGHVDLAGNVSEWVLDWDRNATYAGPCFDCAYLTPGSWRVRRGGAFWSATATLLPSYSASTSIPMLRSAEIGIRCARTP